jgi:pimeloyl-ACP methyl ester carboxylesterase
VYRQSPTYNQSFHWRETGRGNGPTVVLLHGFLAHSMAFRKVMGQIGRYHRVVVPDLPGHGRDQTFRADSVSAGIEDLVGWLQEFLRVLDADQVHLFGHSLGALMAFVAGREENIIREIDKIGLVSPGIRIGIPPWISRVVDALPANLARLGATELGLRAYEPIQWRQSRMDADEIDKYLEPLQDTERLDFMLDLGSDLISEPDRLPGAHRLKRPALILTGEDDHLLPVETIRSIHRAIPDSRLHVIDGVGHCPMEDAPREFTDQALTFLAGKNRAKAGE